ncbi:MAG: hypothetical protein EOO27_46570 [Comamonadaceae bacterium]|nr:MAG: hypothetical protein EOO27_46570 [Comamonadaceae bacterium]
MRISETEWIPATQHQTWEALVDPEVLQHCIPGCVEVARTSPTEYHVTLHTRVAGIEASYEGEILMSDVNAPDSCTLAFEGKGAAAGLAIGTAQINLAQKEQGTRLTYTVAAMNLAMIFSAAPTRARSPHCASLPPAMAATV